MTAALVVLAAAFIVFAILMATYFSRIEKRLAKTGLRRRLGAKENDASLLRFADEERSRLRRLLDESGLGLKTSTFFQWTFTAAAAASLVGVLIGGLIPAVFLGLVGLSFFPLRVMMAKQKRMMLCDQQMPQALQLMVLALRAGHALPGALALAARESPMPLREELRISVEEHKLGSAMGQVVERLAIRLRECESAQTFAVAILVLEQTGGNLIQVIERIIEGARARTQYKARLRALTAEGRWSAIILGSMPLAFFLIAGILDPTYWPTLFHDHMGHIILITVLTMWVCGCSWTYRLMKKGSAT
jgi:tight adherence protein B